MSMKQPEYTEGPEALENFIESMKALIKVPKPQLSRPRRRSAGGRLTSRAQSVRKPRLSDKDPER